MPLLDCVLFPVRDYEGFNEDGSAVVPSFTRGIRLLGEGPKNSQISDQRLQVDIQYLMSCPLADMKILARTIPAVLKRLGAV